MLTLEPEQLLLGVFPPALLLQGPDELEAHLDPLGAEPGENHALSTYAAIAAAAETGGDPSVQQVVAGMHEAGYLSSGSAATHTTSFQAVTGHVVERGEIRK